MCCHRSKGDVRCYVVYRRVIISNIKTSKFRRMRQGKYQFQHQFRPKFDAFARYSAQCFCKRVRFDVSVDPMTAKCLGEAMEDQNLQEKHFTGAM